MIENLFPDIEKNHAFELTDNPSEVDNFEKKQGCILPEDLKTFYRRYKTVSLYPHDNGWKYLFVPVVEMKSVGFEILGESYLEDATASWFAFCDVMDGNYIAIDIQSEKDKTWNYIDCFHETFGIPGECEVIAKTFTELLKKSLEGGDVLFYLKDGFKGYGDALEINKETAIQRIELELPQSNWVGKLIQKIKYSQIQAGWRVQFIQGNVSYRKFFSDKEYGGRRKALEAAEIFLNESKK